MELPAGGEGLGGLVVLPPHESDDDEGQSFHTQQSQSEQYDEWVDGSRWMSQPVPAVE